jgi:hypothetical protein
LTSGHHKYSRSDTISDAVLLGSLVLFGVWVLIFPPTLEFLQPVLASPVIGSVSFLGIISYVSYILILCISILIIYRIVVRIIRLEFARQHYDIDLTPENIVQE